jgi:hypothetical protein
MKLRMYSQTIFFLNNRFNFIKTSDNLSRKIKAKDQYGTVLTLPKGMKPHVKNTAETTEATGMFRFIY